MDKQLFTTEIAEFAEKTKEKLCILRDLYLVFFQASIQSANTLRGEQYKSPQNWTLPSASFSVESVKSVAGNPEV